VHIQYIPTRTKHKIGSTNYGLFTSCLHLSGYPNSLIPFHSKQELLRGYTRNVASKNKTFLGLHVKCQIFLPSCNQFGVWQIFIKVPNIKFHRICPMGTAFIYKYRWTDMMKLIAAFCDYINAPYNTRSQYIKCLQFYKIRLMNQCVTIKHSI